MGLVTDYFPEGEESIQITLIKQPVEEALYKQLRREAEMDVELDFYTVLRNWTLEKGLISNEK